MKKILLLSALLVTAVFLNACDNAPGGNTTAPQNTTSNNSSAPSSANSEADVKKLIGDLAAALSKNDTAGLDKIYGDDYILVTQTGEVFTKAQRVDAIKAGELKFENVAFSDIKVRSYGDTAVAIAASKGKSTNKGVAQETSYRVTFVANKSKDGWRLVSAHLAPLPEAAKSDDAAKKEETNKASETNK